MKSEDLIADTEQQLAYTLRGITYLPHYDGRKVFVAPGYFRQHNLELTAEQLIKAGARAVYIQLWPRPKQRRTLQKGEK